MNNSDAYKKMIEDGTCVVDKDGDVTKWSDGSGLVYWDKEDKEWCHCDYHLTNEFEPYLACSEPIGRAGIGSLDELSEMNEAIFDGDRVYKDDNDNWCNYEGDTLLDHSHMFHELLDINNWEIA